MDKIRHHQKVIVHIPSRSLFNIVVDKTPKKTSWRTKILHHQEEANNNIELGGRGLL